MGAPLSEDLRKRVIAAVEEEGLSRSKAALRFRVSKKSAIRWVRIYRDEGRSHALPMGQGREPDLEKYRDQVLALVTKEPDWPIWKYTEALEADGIITSDSGITRLLKRAGITRKKRR